MTEARAPTGAGSERALDALLQQLRERHHGAVNSILLYGSCLRSGDIFDGLVDLYLVCDSYGSAYAGHGLAMINWLLPPNVFYAELEHEGRTLRSKYALISTADFRRGCSTRRFESYIWGRFAQPVRIAYCRDRSSRETVEQCLLQASRTFLQRALPCLPASGPVFDLWRDALALSYGSELRAERSGRAAELVQASLGHFEGVTRRLQGALDFPFSVHESEQGLNYRADIPGYQRLTGRSGWFLRRLYGKLMSVLRLLKGLFTFDGGIDYVVWKLARHSGQEVVVPDRVRRYPLLFMWGFFWRLYRRGAFR
ncbi:MAG TPA: hypothetical protein VET88_01730 [Gammaproteobacteria bacterium]|nr:hypothetical protein [Gammaproteobacteria bacterium]